jgi:hypothetical protein
MPNEQGRIATVVDALEARSGRGVDHDTLVKVVKADFGRFSAARVKDFVPILVERNVRDWVVRSQRG